MLAAVPPDPPGAANWRVPSDLARPSEAGSDGKPPRPSDPGPRRPPRPPRPEHTTTDEDRPRRFGLRNTVVDRGSERATTGPTDRTVVGPTPSSSPTVARVDPTAPALRPSGTGSAPSAKASRPRTVDATGPRRGRRVRRVIRRIDLWSVLKLSLILYLCMYVATLATLAALWGIAYSSGTIDKLQSFLGDVGLENFHFYGARMFKACAAVGGVGVIAATVATVLAVAIVNVVSEITGGIRVVVIEEDVAPR